jgi:hypothetical protein
VFFVTEISDYSGSFFGFYDFFQNLRPKVMLIPTSNTTKIIADMRYKGNSFFGAATKFVVKPLLITSSIFLFSEHYLMDSGQAAPSHRQFGSSTLILAISVFSSFQFVPSELLNAKNISTPHFSFIGTVLPFQGL